MTKSIENKGSAAKGFSRRKFLQGVSAAASAMAIPGLIPASALGKGGTVAPSERIIVGGIGLGGRGTGDLGAMLGEPDVQFVAVCEVRKSLRDAIKAMVDGRYGSKDCATYTDIRHFLAERTPGAEGGQIISTRSEWRGAGRDGDFLSQRPAHLPHAHAIPGGRTLLDGA